MVDRKCKVTLGGLPQKIHIRGDETKPVLLFLHGGPGVCNRHTVMTVHADLQKDFLVVAWDQRGSGGSYKGAAVETLTIDRLVDYTFNTPSDPLRSPDCVKQRCELIDRNLEILKTMA